MSSRATVEFRLSVANANDPGRIASVRTLNPGDRLTIGAMGSDLPLGDPFGRAAYCTLEASLDALNVSCASEARGAWIYLVPPDERDDPAEQLLQRAPSADNLDAAVLDPIVPERFWLRTRTQIRPLPPRRAVRLVAPDHATGVVPRFGVLCVLDSQILIERIPPTPSTPQGNPLRKRSVAASATRSPIVVHSARPSLEQRVRDAATPSDLESLLEGFAFDCEGNDLRSESGAGPPEGPWFLSTAPGLAPPARHERFADLVAAVQATSAISPQSANAALYEIPVVLRTAAPITEPWALVIAAPAGSSTRGLAYPLRNETLGREIGDLIAQRVGQFAEIVRPKSWTDAKLPGATAWSTPPTTVAWRDLDTFLDRILADFPPELLPSPHGAWDHLQRALETELAHQSLPADAVTEAASHLAYRTKNLALAGYVASQTLGRRLDQLTEKRVSLRRLTAEQVIDLMEIAILAMNYGVIGDDNRRKLLNRLGHVYLLFAPSERDGSARRLLLPSGHLAVLDARASEAHERWATEVSARKGDRRLLDGLSDSVGVIDRAAAMLEQWGFAPPPDRIADARGRLQAMGSG